MICFQKSVCARPLLAVLLCLAAAATAGPARATVATAGDGRFAIGDATIMARGQLRQGRWGGVTVMDRSTGHTVELPEAYQFRLGDGTLLRSTAMEITRPFTVEELRAEPRSSRAVEHLRGQQVCAEFREKARGLDVTWCGILRDRSNYFRQQVTVKTGAAALPIREVRLLEFKDARARVTGSVAGSPVTDATMFFGFEHPLSISEVNGGRVTAALKRELPVAAGQSVTWTSVIGVAPEGQMRRAFLHYVERERAHPYRPFLQYNSWYDLGYNTRYDERGALDRIHAFGRELTKKRDAKVESFVFDDGWDDQNSLWEFDQAFPNGFIKASQAAAEYKSHIGLWLSPWGGYHEQKQRRVAFGKARGYEVVNGGFALSGPKYYAAFEKTCLDMISRYGANEFKFDGTGNANRVFPGSAFDSDFDAMLSLIHRLRQAEPDIFINLTTGTYPSPWWLFDSDAIWRGGEDHDFAGVGSSRQRWITYRDAQVYRHEVEQGPLFPLNSLMLHGIIDAQFAKGLKSSEGEDFRDEVESFFGSGTQVEEMYVTPALLSAANWDALARGAKWARANAETLQDTHWIGGDPAKLEVYGWASWSPQKAIVVLRNPSDKPQSYTLDVARTLELPAGAAREYVARDPWNESETETRLEAGKTVEVSLDPFEVRTFDARAVR